jgi:hypothetical protein
MKKSGRVSALVLAFFSAELYRDVVRRWNGAGLMYLALLLAVCWLPSPIRWFSGLHTYAVEHVPQLAGQLPDITISNGTMQASPPGRHVIRDLESNAKNPTFLIIDDTIDEVPADLETSAIIVTRKQFGVIRRDRNERRSWTFTPDTDLQITRQDVGAFLSSLQFWVPPVGYAFCFLGSFIFRFLQACLYGWLARLFARQKGITLDVRAGLRLATVAITPVVVIRTLLWFLPAEPSWYIRWPAAIIITVLYLKFAVRALAEEAPTVAV